MSLELWRQEINTHLIKTLDDSLPKHDFNDVIRYSVLPAGKLFRPLLVYSLANDLGAINDGHRLLATSIELHHTYTLIHDDLPSMDNDDFRRGRPSSHKKFNEWSAILAGDGLLNLSYGILSRVDSSKLSHLLQLYSELMGPKGLILGQVKDLGQENDSLEDLIQIHELKTARLIQLSLMGSNLLSTNPIDSSICEKLGYALGINFQLLDDLCELTEPINKHESEINPFLHFDQKDLFKIIESNTDLLRGSLDKYKLSSLKDYINIYIDKINSILSSGENILVKNVEDKYLSIIRKLKI